MKRRFAIVALLVGGSCGKPVVVPVPETSPSNLVTTDPVVDLSSTLVMQTGVALDPTGPLPSGDGPGVVAEAGSRIEVRGAVSDRSYITIELPELTCLYDRVDGEVIGMQTRKAARTAVPAEQPGWWTVSVGSLWGVLPLVAHAPIDFAWKLCR